MSDEHAITVVHQVLRQVLVILIAELQADPSRMSFHLSEALRRIGHGLHPDSAAILADLAQGLATLATDGDAAEH